MKHQALKKTARKSCAGHPKRQKLALILDTMPQGPSLNLFALRVFADKLLSCPLASPAAPALPAGSFVKVTRIEEPPAVNFAPPV